MELKIFTNECVGLFRDYLYNNESGKRVLKRKEKVHMAL